MVLDSFKSIILIYVYAFEYRTADNDGLKGRRRRRKRKREKEKKKKKKDDVSLKLTGYYAFARRGGKYDWPQLDLTFVYATVIMQTYCTLVLYRSVADLAKIHTLPR